MPIFQGLGRALRWLRDRQSKRQYQVADAAGITKAMLSAYETGKQKPSLDTLEKILAALDGDLNDLHNALQIVNERPEAIRKGSAKSGAWQLYRRDRQEETDDAADLAAGVDLYRVLGVDHPLPPQEEQALTEMLEGFHKLIRFFHQSSTSLGGRDEEEIDS
ncbi:MAG TPA: helix-turn-helix transcriptional regulator [Thermoanaerobaculia bacterium]|nr:helix-turn-helix transcriptional regulator [Thermoanaerobaculia bacterium]